MPATSPLARSLIGAARSAIDTHRRNCEAAAAQLTDEQLHHRIHSEANSVVVIMTHLAGSLLSRWTDFLTSDGEKPWRDREGEFRDARESREQVLVRWNRAFGTLDSALDGLVDEDLLRTVTIRGEPHTVPDAITRTVAHIAYHTGQLLLVARLIRGGEGWKWLTIAPGGSAAFNEGMARRHGGS